MELVALFIMINVYIIFFLILTYIIKEVAYIFNPLFFLLNRIQWILYNPLRILYKNPNSNFPQKTFNFLLYTGVVPVYWLFIHIVSLPLRLINAIYFNILLSWSINLYDSLAEVINPKLGKFRRISGIKYFIYWIIHFPVRIFNLIVQNIFTVIEPFIMTGFDIVWPTYTMYHGTDFEGVATDIAQRGRWFVGNGNYAGTGIYFGMSKKVAEHYSGSNTIILARVTLTFNRNIATTKYSIRRNIGAGGGDEINRQLFGLWASIEHWRKDMGWFEYCVIQPTKKRGKFVTTWRARPIAIVKDNKLVRIWGGKSIYPSFSSLFVIIATWIFLIFIISLSG